MVWCTVWLYFISEDPREDKYISAEELKYITENQDSAERPNVRLYKKNDQAFAPHSAISVVTFSFQKLRGGRC